MPGSTDATKLEGGCACAGVRYRLRSTPIFVNCCHCRECQRHTGSAFVINAVIEADRIESRAGAPEPVGGPTTSGRPHDIYRCPTCRTALWSDYGNRPIRFLRVGTLDEPSLLPPGAHIFTGSKLAWVPLPEGVPAFCEYYDMHTMYPVASLARRRAVLGDEG